MIRTLLLSTTILLTAQAAFAQSTRPAETQPSTPTRTRIADQPYVTGGGIRQQLDLYLPTAPHAQPLPIVIWIHGGGWSAGSKGDRGGPFPQLTDHGFAVACINYRFTDVAPMPAQLQDCKAAVRWLRAHAKTYGLDADHIAVWGHSAGGHLAALVGLTGDTRQFSVGDDLDQSEAVQAVIEWAGPIDLLAMAHKSLTDPHDILARLVGGPLKDKPDEARAASPITYVHAGAPPFLITHSDADPGVPFAQAELLRDALTRAGVSVTWYPLHGVPHWDKAFVSDKSFAVCLEFLNKTLKPSASDPAQHH